MEKEQKIDTNLPGLHVNSGIIMGKNRFPGRNGSADRLNLDIAVPGCRDMLSVSVNQSVFDLAQEGSIKSFRLSARRYQGGTFFEELEK